MFYAVIALNLFLTNVPIADVYSGPFQTSKTELFGENRQRLQAADCFETKALSWISDRALNVPQHRVLYFHCGYSFEVSAVVFRCRDRKQGFCRQMEALVRNELS